MEDNSLDSLARGGIINFDANAFVKNTAPRYVGRPEPQLYLPFDEPLCETPVYGVRPGENLAGAPSKDAFMDNNKPKGHKTFLAFLAGTCLGILGYHGGSKLKPKYSDKLENSKIKKHTNNLRTRLAAFISPVKTKTTASEPEAEMAKSSTVQSEKAAVKEETIKSKFKIVNTVKDFLKTHSKGAKITGAGLVGVLGLYGLYQMVKPKHPQAQKHPEQPQIVGH